MILHLFLKMPTYKIVTFYAVIVQFIPLFTQPLPEFKPHIKPKSLTCLFNDANESSLRPPKLGRSRGFFALMFMPENFT